jgi:hypothetical protein
MSEVALLGVNLAGIEIADGQAGILVGMLVAVGAIGLGLGLGTRKLLPRR